VEHETHRRFQQALEHKTYADAKRILKDFEQWCKETTASDKAGHLPPNCGKRLLNYLALGWISISEATWKSLKLELSFKEGLRKSGHLAVPS